MKKTYDQVVKQIENLQQEAEKLRRQEVDGVVARIRDAMQHYGLTAADLGVVAKAGAAAPKAASKAAVKRGQKPGKAKSTAPREPKFRDEMGRTWGGVGKRPQWLRDALASGKTLQEFAVQ